MSNAFYKIGKNVCFGKCFCSLRLYASHTIGKSGCREEIELVNLTTESCKALILERKRDPICSCRGLLYPELEFSGRRKKDRAQSLNSCLHEFVIHLISKKMWYDCITNKCKFEWRCNHGKWITSASYRRQSSEGSF